jgi:hypothetical protein
VQQQESNIDLPDANVVDDSMPTMVWDEGTPEMWESAYLASNGNEQSSYVEASADRESAEESKVADNDKTTDKLTDEEKPEEGHKLSKPALIAISLLAIFFSRLLGAACARAVVSQTNPTSAVRSSVSTTTGYSSTHEEREDGIEQQSNDDTADSDEADGQSNSDSSPNGAEGQSSGDTPDYALPAGWTLEYASSNPSYYHPIGSTAIVFVPVHNTSYFESDDMDESQANLLASEREFRGHYTNIQDSEAGTGTYDGHPALLDSFDGEDDGIPTHVERLSILTGNGFYSYSFWGDPEAFSEYADVVQETFESIEFH